ncbi:MAG TPA: hypothetical protein VFG83_09900 [Kofleriaceae bacterium]|nr:hypothetical protein [Kofleriaceae bacterium]
MPRDLRYEEPPRLEQAEALRVLREGSSEEVARALLAVVLHEEDFGFALSLVVDCARSDRPEIRGIGVLCLGHLARIHGRIPEDPVLQLVEAALSDESSYVRGQAENAADDIAMFVPAVGRKLRCRSSTQ